MNRNEPWMSIAPPAWKFFVPLLLLAVAGGFLHWAVALAWGILAVYVLYFFRDPGRHVPSIPGAVASPADGKVVSVIEVPCEQMPGGRARRVAIFLSIFNVHLQRSAVTGEVTEVVRKPGKCINALNEKCSEENEQVTIWLRGEDGVFGIRQISGAIARRIVCNARVGDFLERGQRYGIIQFGSRVELFLPLEASVRVKPGQFVKGGATCLALMHEEDTRRGKSPSRESSPRVPALHGAAPSREAGS